MKKYHVLNIPIDVWEAVEDQAAGMLGTTPSALAKKHILDGLNTTTKSGAAKEIKKTNIKNKLKKLLIWDKGQEGSYFITDKKEIEGFFYRYEVAHIDRALIDQVYIVDDGTVDSDLEWLEEKTAVAKTIEKQCAERIAAQYEEQRLGKLVKGPVDPLDKP